MKQLKKMKSNILHIFRFIYEIDKGTFFTLSIAVILSGLVALPSLIFPKLIIDEFVTGQNFQNLVRYTLLYVGLTLIINASSQFTASKLEKQAKLTHCCSAITTRRG